MHSSWREQKLQRSTHLSGDTFEEEVLSVLKRYTDSVWHNIKIETLLTQQGYTELDIVFCHAELIYVLELKRVSEIKGAYGDSKWLMRGWKNRNLETNEYWAMNVIEQNNIHCRSLSDLYHSEFRHFPTIVPVVVVPNDCTFPEELSGQVYHLEDLEEYVRSLNRGVDKYMGYRVSYLLGDNSHVVPRKDFAERRRKSGSEVRGKRR